MFNHIDSNLLLGGRSDKNFGGKKSTKEVPGMQDGKKVERESS